MKQHKATILNRYMSYLTTVHSLDTGHQFAFDEAQIIGQAQSKAGRLFMEAIYSDENLINRHITLDPCYDLIKDRLTRCTALIYYKNPCIKKYTNADEVVSQLDRRKLHPNNECLVDPF